MGNVIFYEKPGCINNTKQKALLIKAGHKVDARNILTTVWTKESLEPFLANLPVSSWFNGSAPRIKSGEIKPENLNKEMAIDLILADPLLIRRPLIQVGDRYEVGFDSEKIADWIGLTSVELTIDMETCPRSLNFPDV